MKKSAILEVYRGERGDIELQFLDNNEINGFDDFCERENAFIGRLSRS